MGKHAPSHDRAIQTALFLFFAALYLLVEGDHLRDAFDISDEYRLAWTTITLVEKHSLIIPEETGATIAKQNFLQSIVGIPFYLVGRSLAGLVPEALRKPVIGQTFHFTNAVIGALILMLFYGLSRRLRYPPATALGTTVVLGATTVLFPYARTFFGEPLAALTLLGSVAALDRYTRTARLGSLACAAAWLGAASLARPDNAVLLPVLLLATAWTCRIRGRPFPAAMGMLAGPLAATVLAALLINQARYGHPLQTGYRNEGFSTPLWVGLHGLLASPSRGLFIYSPPLLAACFAWGAFLRRRPTLGWIVLGLVALKLYWLGKWWNWEGGWCWGSRLLLPIVPLLALSLNEPLMRWRRLSGAGRGGLAALLAAGAVVQLLAVLTDPNKYSLEMQSLSHGDWNRMLFLPQSSPLVGAWQQIEQGQVDNWFPAVAARLGAGLAWAIAIGLGGVLLACGWRLMRLSGLEAVLGGWRLNLGDPWRRAAAATLALGVGWFAIGWMIPLFNGAPRQEIRQVNGTPTLIGLRGERYLGVEGWSALSPGDAPPTFYRWSGWLATPVKGPYRFAVRTSGAHRLQIEGEPISSSDGAPGIVVQEAKIPMEKGGAPFLLEYEPADPRIPMFQIYWTSPGFGFENRRLSMADVFDAYPGPTGRALAAMAHYRGLALLLALMAAATLTAMQNRRRPTD